MKLLQSLSESQLLSSTTAYRRFTAKQIAELVYLHVIAVRILAAEPLGNSFAADYAHRSVRYMGFAKWYQNATDLHLLIHGLLDENVDLKMPDSSQSFKETLYFDENEIRFWLKDITNHHVNEARTRKLFMHLDGQFQIKDGSMKAIRRLVQDWPRNSARQKQLSMTRLLQMMRVRARRSDLLIRLERLATELKLELHNVSNPETGDVAKETGADPEHVKKPGFLKSVAAVGVGAMLGYHAVKHLSEGKVAHRDGSIVIFENPSPAQFLSLKTKADHGDGVRAMVIEGNLYVWDGAHLSHDGARSILKGTPLAEMHLWGGYIEIDASNLNEDAAEEKIDAVHDCVSLMAIYENEPLVHFDGMVDVAFLGEDADAGVTCSADFAPFVQVLGSVQRRKRKKKKKS